MNKGFFELLDAELERIFEQLGGDPKVLRADAANLRKELLAKETKVLKDPVVFNHTRLHNLQITLGMVALNLPVMTGSLEGPTTPVSYINEAKEWSVINLPLTILEEVFALELKATDSLPMILALYTEDLEAYRNAKTK